jgi:hypothetical protein
MSWRGIQKPSSDFFRWLFTNKIFLNLVEFHTTTLVACRFLHGAHPGYLHRDEAEKELDKCLNPEKDQATPFQLSAHTITVPVEDGKLERFSFQAVGVETGAFFFSGGCSRDIN